MNVVTCNGCFVNLHAGHYMFLGYCRAHGDKLVVGINDDEYLYQKHGSKVADFNVNRRKKELLDSGIVDQVLVFHDDPVDFLEQVEPKPSIHCTGREYLPEAPETDYCEKEDITLIYVPRFGMWSSTSFMSSVDDYKSNVSKAGWYEVRDPNTTVRFDLGESNGSYVAHHHV